MLSDQALPKYRDASSLLNELYCIVQELEERSAKANKLLFENKLTEPQKEAYDKMTKELAVLKHSHLIMEKLLLHHSRLIKVKVATDEWTEIYNEYKKAIHL